MLAGEQVAAARLTPRRDGRLPDRWRMDLAAARPRDTVGRAVAGSLGYTSEYAFNRALTRDRHIPPGRYRTYSRATHQPAPSAYPAGQGRRRGDGGQRQVQPPST